MNTKYQSSIEVLTVEDLTASFHVKPETIRRWIKKYKIPVIKIGRCIYLRPEAVDMFLNNRTVENTHGHPSIRER